MGSGDIKQVRELIASSPDWSQMDVPDTRAFYDQLGQQFPVPDGVAVEGTVVGGINAEWVRAANCRTDAVLLYLHGGGYVIGSPASHRHQVAALSQAAGVAALSLDYRRGPEHPFPAAVDDAISAYQGLLDANIAPQRIVVAGDSAGGGLTIATLLSLRERGLPQAAAGICISPWVDLTMTAETYSTKAALDPIVTREGLIGMAQAYLQGQEAQLPLASPLFADLTTLPPLLIHVGTDEVLLDDALQLGANAKAAGVNVTLEVWDKMIHVWHFFYPLLSEGRDAIARIGAFVQAHIQ